MIESATQSESCSRLMYILYNDIVFLEAGCTGSDINAGENILSQVKMVANIVKCVVEQRRIIKFLVKHIK